jgi:hypothetical protein
VDKSSERFVSYVSVQNKVLIFDNYAKGTFQTHSRVLDINPLTAATSLDVKRFRVLNSKINIKDIL